MTKRSKTTAQPALSKKAQVQAMLEADPTPVATISERMGISKTAAYSLINDLKRAGVAITGTMRDGSMCYSVVKPRKRAKAQRVFGRNAVQGAVA